MPHPLESGTIRIHKPDGSTAGTGFILSEHVAVTCAHVIEYAGSNPGDIIDFSFHLGNLGPQKARVVEHGWSLDDDVAILELVEKPPRWICPIIMQSSSFMEGRTFIGLGYPDDGAVHARWPQGNISGRVDVSGYTTPLYQIQGKEIDKGLSGSAIVDRTTRRVVGMITAYQDVNRPSKAEPVRFGYAIPIETIWKVFPELELEVPPLPKRSPLVEGIHLLPHGYDFRIQNFLAEYLGTPEHPEPFGGRTDVFIQLNEWLDSDNQRLLLTAPGGRGKSALLVRWLSQLVTRDDLAIAFVPVSVRFRTNLSSVFFACLSARLAYLHGEDVPTGDIMSTEMWRGLANTYLTRTIPGNKALLLVLDGVDEASDWEAASDLVPSELPTNVHVVISARLIAGDRDGKSWLSRLGWEHSTRAETLNLSKLDLAGVADVISHMGAPLDHLSQRVDIVSELYRLSEGDPLLVNLYVEDLWSRGGEAGRLQLGDLQTIRPGYEGYFARWWLDQKKLWGDEAPFREKSVQLVFNLLCAGMGGLTKDDFQSLLAAESIHSLIIEESLETLKRFVIGVPDERRESETSYVLTHPKLRDYFWERLTNKEKTTLEAQFIQWGASIIQSLIAEELKPMNVPSYLLHYYGAHLVRAQVAVESFLPFVDHPYWHQAWFEYEETYAGYFLDLKRTLKSCSTYNQQALKENRKPDFLGKEVRCLLIESSLHSLAGRIFPELVTQLVQSRVWTPTQSIVYLGQVSDSKIRSETLFALFSVLDSSHLDEILLIAQGIRDENFRASTLIKLVALVPEEKRKLLIEQAELAAQSIANEETRSGILSDLAGVVLGTHRDDLIVMAQSLARKVENSWSRMRLLIKVIPYLADQQREHVIDEALSLARKEIAPNARSSALLEVACQLSGDRRESTLMEALQVTRQIQHDWEQSKRTETLIELAKLLSGEQREAVLREAFSIIEHPRTGYIAKGDPLIPLVPLLPDDLLVRAWNRAKTLSPLYSADVFLEVAKRLPAAQRNMAVKDALLAARQISEEWRRGPALVRVASCILGPERETVFREALEIAQNSKYDFQEEHVSLLLIDLAKEAPETMLEELLEAARHLARVDYRARVLNSVAYRLNGSQKHAILNESLLLARRIRDSFKRARLLSSLVEYLPDETLELALSEAGKLDIHCEEYRGSMLAILAKRLPEEALAQVLNAVSEISNIEKYRAATLSVLAERAPDAMLEQILFLAERSGDYPYKVWTLRNLAKRAPHRFLGKIDKEVIMEAAYISTINSLAERLLTGSLSISLLPVLISLIGRIEAEHERARLLIVLGKRLPTSDVGRVLSAVNTLRDERYRVWVLQVLVVRLPTSLHASALSSIFELKEAWQRAEVLRDFAVQLSPDRINDVWQHIRTMDGNANQILLISVIGRYLPANLLEEALSLTHALKSNWDRVRALSALSTSRSLPEDQRRKILDTVWSMLQETRNASEVAGALKIIFEKEPPISKVQQYQLWAQSTSILQTRTREELFLDLEELIPFLLSLGDSNTMDDVFLAVCDATEWWP